MTDLINDPTYTDQIERDRARLISELEGRPENFVVNGKLATLNGPTPSFLPEYKRRE